MKSKPDQAVNANGSVPHRIDWQAELARHDQWLRAVATARLGERQAVDEVMQEVSLAAIRQRAPIQDPTRTAPWLYRLCVLQSLIYRRKKGRQRKFTEHFALRLQSQGQDSRASDPLDFVLEKERRDLVKRALARLAPRDAEILLLKFSQNWSYQQIVEHLGIPATSVGPRLHRAKQRLREELAALNIVEVA